MDKGYDKSERCRLIVIEVEIDTAHRAERGHVAAETLSCRNTKVSTKLGYTEKF